MSSATLVVGGARSGKSAFAERLVADSGREPVYLATAEALDAEMAERIAHHRDRRGPAWRTVEEPLDLAGAIARHDRPDTFILVDCLTLWLSNLMAAGADIEAETERLCATIPAVNGALVLVGNEVGLGIVPERADVRAYRDSHGRLNQAVATACDQVILMACGLPLRLKPNPDTRFTI